MDADNDVGKDEVTTGNSNDGASTVSPDRG